MTATYKTFQFDTLPSEKQLSTFILSYKGNEEMAERLVWQLNDQGFPSATVVYAPDMSKVEYKRSRVVYHTFKNYLLPKMIEADNDCLVFEDDADIYSPYSKYVELADKWGMNRIAWWKMNRAKGVPSFCVGSTIVSYKKEFITRLKTEFDKGREQHIDGFLTKKFKWKEDWDFEPNFGFGGTCSHYSYILEDKFRKGNVGSDAPRGYTPPTVKTGYKTD